jgi:hypothetical protein
LLCFSSVFLCFSLFSAFDWQSNRTDLLIPLNYKTGQTPFPSSITGIYFAKEKGLLFCRII